MCIHFPSRVLVLLPGLVLEVEQAVDGDLEHDQDADAVDEFFMLGFVAEKVHGQEGAQGSPGGGQDQKDFFGDSPAAAFGLKFVVAVDQEGQDIDKAQIVEKGLV
jgi:hypothetical protein